MQTSIPRMTLLAGLAAGSLALVAACGGGAGGSSSQPPAPNQAASGQVQGTKVTATLTEFHIALSQSTFTPGTYTFVATDSGHATHALAINGPGVNNQATGDVSPGQSANLTVTLKSGTYDVYCPVDDHKAMGMDLTIKVGSGGSTGSSGMTGMPPANPTTSGGYGGGSGGGGYGGY